MSRRSLAVVLALGLVGCGRTGQPGAGTGAPDAVLPFYAEASFTAIWSGEVAHRIAPFSLVTQAGSPVTERDLAGRIHVASFFFTQCPNICPALVPQLKRVQAATAGSSDVLLVSYSVTPAYDTPRVLARFGREREIDPRRWLLVTGAADTIFRLAHDSYFADDRRFGELPGGQILLHTEKVLLVDPDGRLRGVYNGIVPFDIDRLIEDIATLRRSLLHGRA